MSVVASESGPGSTKASRQCFVDLLVSPRLSIILCRQTRSINFISLWTQDHANSAHLPICLWSLNPRSPSFLEERIERHECVRQILQHGIFALRAHLARHGIERHQPVGGLELSREVAVMPAKQCIVFKTAYLLVSGLRSEAAEQQ